MTVLEIARLQFATTTIIHFLFVLLTLGLVTLLVVLQTTWAITKKPMYERQTRFWGRLYVINYFLGIATGVVLELQFGTSWSGLSHYLGNVFGAPLAMETIIAFFLESTFLGLWIFGWGRLNRWVHTALIWLVALTAYASVFWVMVANSFLQHPVGYDKGADGVIRLTDIGALLSNKSLVMALPHVVFAAISVGGFVMAGISAWHFIRRTQEVEFFRKSLRLGVVTAAIGGFFVVGFGYAQYGFVADLQPTKFGDDAAKAAAVADFTARFGPGDYNLPAYASTALGFMILIGNLLPMVMFAIPLFFRDWIIRWRFPLYLLLLAIPLPFLAASLGWLFREGGRQPFAAYGLLPLQDAVTPGGSAGAMLTAYAVFTTVLVALAVTDWVLIARAANRGPVDPAPDALTPLA
ncbi:cytochrome d ubiquinol oxidase subunit I [Hamadaea flava]|uniref:Cytochrome ubiquinol oxidase subunit I n=1 Tax=Hamadaea flava TaxID=1742688 RepID=A0ABV8LKN4_9ACTN|nr:cytochrome ubiquinol oxidase subunit I [Hamadaea flava]MCP2325488.1 cytochrome d ubiquinol oxidase subunit I [Hamadaea flava]